MVKILNTSRLELLEVPGESLAGAMLANSYLRDADLRNVDLTGTDLRDSNMQGAVLDGATLDNAKLDNACLNEVSGVRASFVNATLESTSLNNSNFSESSFAGASVGTVTADNSQFCDCDFTDATLCIESAAWASFRNATFGGSSSVCITALNTDFRGASVDERKHFVILTEYFDSETSKIQQRAFPHQFDFFSLAYHMGPYVDETTRWNVVYENRPLQIKNMLILIAVVASVFATACYMFGWPLSVALVNTVIVGVAAAYAHVRAVMETNAEFDSNPMKFLSLHGHRIEPDFWKMFTRGQPAAEPLPENFSG